MKIPPLPTIRLGKRPKQVKSNHETLRFPLGGMRPSRKVLPDSKLVDFQFPTLSAPIPGLAPKPSALSTGIGDAPTESQAEGLMSFLLEAISVYSRLNPDMPWPAISLSKLSLTQQLILRWPLTSGLNGVGLLGRAGPAVVCSACTGKGILGGFLCLPCSGFGLLDFERADQSLICEFCRLEYGRHPFEPTIRDWDNRWWLTKLCSGRLVKL